MVTVTLRPFEERDFATLTSWVPTPDALAQWCAAFFKFPLDDLQLRRYLDSAAPHTREIFAAQTQAGEAVGHIEVSMIWPHLSCRLSRIIVDPNKRAQGVGRMMVSLAVSHVFVSHHVDRIDLGVSEDNAAAINCYQGEGFAHVGTWQNAITTEVRTINVYWMTLTRAAWLARRVNSN